MALAVLLKTESFTLATDRAVLKRADVAALENTVELLHTAVAEADRIREDAQRARRALAEALRREHEDRVREATARAAMAAQVGAASLLRSVEPALVEVVVDAVARLAASLDRRQILAQAIAEVSQAVGRQSFAVLKVAPADLAFASDAVAELMNEARLPATLTVRADAAVAAGDCILMSDLGKLSIGLSQQLGALRHALRAALAAVADAQAAPAPAHGAAAPATHEVPHG